MWDQLETELVGYARDFDPHSLGECARVLRDCYLPDGSEHEAAVRERAREFTISPRPDGSARISGEATAELTEYLRTCLDPLAKPKTGDGVPDSRTAAQRRHDALLNCAGWRWGRAAAACRRRGTTVLLTMSQQTWETGAGWCRSGHGARIPARQALRWCSGDTRIMQVILDPGRDRRLHRPAPVVHPHPTPGHDRPGRRLLLPRL